MVLYKSRQKSAAVTEVALYYNSLYIGITKVSFFSVEEFFTGKRYLFIFFRGKLMNLQKAVFESKAVRKLTYSALCLALSLLLPFLTGQIPEIGSMLCPMHLPVLMCGYLCGWQYGAVVGFAAPFLRMLLFSMPPVYTAIPMAFELALYGAFSGILYRAFGRRAYSGVYLSLVPSMLLGRMGWGVVRFAMAGLNHTEFSFALFLSGAFSTSIPGIILQLVLVPMLVCAAEKSKLVL